MPEEDSHLSDQPRSQAHPSRGFGREQGGLRARLGRRDWAALQDLLTSAVEVVRRH